LINQDLIKIVSNKYIWILGGGKMQYPSIVCANELGYKTIITDFKNDCYCRSYADLFYQIDIFDYKENLKLLKKLKKKYKIKAIFIAGIDCTITASKLAENLNVATSGSKIAKLTNNKYLFRNFLKKNKILDIPCIKVLGYKNKNLLRKIEKKIGYPFIVKNTDNSASRGTQIVTKKINQRKLNILIKKAIEVSRCKYCIVERYYEGTEHTVETLFDIKGKFHPCFITDRFFDHKSGKALEIGLRNPTQLSLKMQKKIYTFVKKISKKIGISIGPAKFDLLIHKNKIIILEMTTRLSGGFDCQYLVPAATGKNVIKAAMLTALRLKFKKNLLDNKLKRIAFSSSIWPKPGIIRHISYKNLVIKKNDYLKVIFTKKIGDRLSRDSCADRPCFIIAASNSEKNAISLLKKAKNKIKILTK
jgi:biotin carboxylase